jgi:hypothetical protein
MGGATEEPEPDADRIRLFEPLLGGFAGVDREADCFLPGWAVVG